MFLCIFGALLCFLVPYWPLALGRAPHFLWLIASSTGAHKASQAQSSTSQIVRSPAEARLARLCLHQCTTTPSDSACAMPRHMLIATLLTAHVCTSLRQLPRQHALQRRAIAAPSLAFLAAVAAPAATALPPPEGCKWIGEGTNRRRITLSPRLSSLSTHAGEYPGRKSGQDVKLINANLDCNENFVKGFGVSEFIVTPAILGLAAVLANINKEE